MASTVGGYTHPYLGASGYRAPPRPTALPCTFARLICLSISIHRLPGSPRLISRRATVPAAALLLAVNCHFPPRPRAPNPPSYSQARRFGATRSSSSRGRTNRLAVAFDQQPVRCCAAAAVCSQCAHLHHLSLLLLLLAASPCRPPSSRPRCERSFLPPR